MGGFFGGCFVCRYVVWVCVMLFGGVWVVVALVMNVSRQQLVTLKAVVPQVNIHLKRIGNKVTLMLNMKLHYCYKLQ